MSRRRAQGKGPEFVLRHSGTEYEQWQFWPDEPALRCVWPTAQRTVLVAPDLPYHVRAILVAYRHLLLHPVGTEACVQRLRALRRAERWRAQGGEVTRG